MKLHFIHIKLNDIDKSKNYLLQAEQHFAELHQIAPQHAQFKRHLEGVRGTIQKMEET